MELLHERIEDCRWIQRKYNFCPDPDWWRGGITYSEAAEEFTSPLEKEFNERAERWEAESAIHSSPGQAFLHKDLIYIMCHMGRKAIPLILERLKTSQSDWLWALENLTDDNPAEGIDDFESAVKAWLEWGRATRYIS